LVLFLLRFPMRAQDHVDYKFEYYREEADRITVNTHTAFAEVGLTGDLTLKGRFVYDGISGATPNGGPPPEGSDQVPLEHLSDVRRAFALELGWRLGAHTLLPQFAYSIENDYESFSPALNYTLDLNEKNTTLTLGVVHNFDRVLSASARWESKDETDFLAGLTQVLSRTTLLTVNLTFGVADGYLSDPYKRVRFDGNPDPESLAPEKRPDDKTREVGLVALNQFVPALNGSAEVTYRIGHDSFGVFSHTAGVQWFQNAGSRVVVAPLFRYYTQTAADFYVLRLPGDPFDPESFPDVVIPPHYSADYRLSELESLTYGLTVTVKVASRFTLDLGYKRYEMHGRDGVTPASSYPAANIWTIGLRARF
jgi:hypothetical protein